MISKRALAIFFALIMVASGIGTIAISTLSQQENAILSGGNQTTNTPFIGTGGAEHESTTGLNTYLPASTYDSGQTITWEINYTQGEGEERKEQYDEYWQGQDAKTGHCLDKHAHNAGYYTLNDGKQQVD